MLAKATYKHGEVSVTEGQEKKHITQMTKDEINVIINKLYSLNVGQTKLSFHLQEKLDSEELSIYKSQMVRLLLDFEIIEYNNTRGGNRVLLRGLSKEKTISKGKIEESNLCIVWDVDKNIIVTAYWNYSDDNHDNVDFSRYNKDLKIAFTN